MTTAFKPNPVAHRIFCLAATGALAFSLGCSKTAKSDNSDPAPVTDKSAAGTDLEAAIADPGPKTVTAVGANGKVEVIDLAKTTLADTDTYLVKAHVPDSVAAGAEGVVTINLTPKTGWKINQEFPTKLAITAPDGVTLTQSSQGAGDASKFTEKAAVFKVAFNAASSGAKAFSADFRFAMCTDATCDPKSAKLAWTATVQ